jgi:hypothetical protein
MTTDAQIETAVTESITTSRTVDLTVTDVSDAVATLSIEHGLEDSTETRGVTEAWGTDADGSEWRLELRADEDREITSIAAGDLPAYTAREVEMARRELVEMLATEDARIAIREGATSPWGDGETLPDVADLRSRLTWLDLDDSDMRREVARAYDVAFRAAIDAEG